MRIFLIAALTLTMIGSGFAADYKNISDLCSRQADAIYFDQVTELMRVDYPRYSTMSYDQIREQQMANAKIEKRIDRSTSIIAGVIMAAAGIWGFNQGTTYGYVTGAYFMVRGGILFYSATF